MYFSTGNFTNLYSLAFSYSHVYLLSPFLLHHVRHPFRTSVFPRTCRRLSPACYLRGVWPAAETRATSILTVTPPPWHETRYRSVLLDASSPHIRYSFKGRRGNWLHFLFFFFSSLTFTPQLCKTTKSTGNTNNLSESHVKCMWLGITPEVKTH